MDFEHFEPKFITEVNTGLILQKTTHEKIDEFEACVKNIEQVFHEPRKEIENVCNSVISRLDSQSNEYIELIAKFKDHVIAYMNNYKENAYSKLEAISEDDKEMVQKLLFKCKEKHNDWMNYINDEHNMTRINDYELMKILIDIYECKTSLFETYENFLFKTQKLYSCEKKFYHLINENAFKLENIEYKDLYNINTGSNKCNDKFYIDINRLKNQIKFGKTIKICSKKSFDCKLFATHGGRVIAVWCEFGMCKLQLIDINENGETLSVINTVTNSASENSLICGSDEGEMISIVFTYDLTTYWLKAYDNTLKELGIVRLHYSPAQLYATETHIYIHQHLKPYIHIYDKQLNELKTIQRDLEPILYYFIRYGDEIVFKNDFVFILNLNSRLDVIQKDTDRVIRSLDMHKIKSFKVDALLRIVLYSEELSKLIICNLKGKIIREIDLVSHTCSFCITDNGYLVTTSGYNGELNIF